MNLQDKNILRTHEHSFYGKRRPLVHCLLVGFGFFVVNSAFSTLNYSLAVSSPGYTYPSGATPVTNFNWGCGDGMVSSSLSIGFTFTYNGATYTTFQVSDNGELFLGGSYTCNDNCGGTCNFSEKEPASLSTGTDRPAICALWDDMAFNTGTALCTYTTTIVGGIHMLTVEWLLMDWKYNNTNSPHGGMSFQVILYESPAGQIDFRYHRESQALGAGTQAPHARIGLMGASGDYYSTDELGSTPSKSSEFIVINKPATGLQLRWTDNTGLPIELLSLKGIYNGNAVIDWQTATETNNDFFTLYRSGDANNFMPVSIIKGAGNSLTLRSYEFIDTSLPDSFNVFYYYLRQTDFNGRASNSEIISVNTVKEKPPNIYFNEHAQELIINYNFIKQEEYLLSVTDMLGRSVCEIKIGGEGHREDIFAMQVSLPGEGIYTARLLNTSGSVLLRSKFLKQ